MICPQNIFPMMKKRRKRKCFPLFFKYNNTLKIGHAIEYETGHGFKKSVLLICVFLVGFITQRPRYLIIYTSNQNFRLARLLKSVSPVRKHVTAIYVLFLACLVTTTATLTPCLPLFARYFWWRGGAVLGGFLPGEEAALCSASL